MSARNKALEKARASTMSAPTFSSLDDFWEQQQHQDLLRFITCGSVDDGKSTLIGRMLWESQKLYEDQVASLKSESTKYGTRGENIDFALLVDGLTAEREQGITIDVAYRYFSTARRKFIVADTPGHEQYTRNMFTGASTADAAVLLVDARKGLLTQTRRHAFLASLVGISHVALAINKMDLVGYSEAIYSKILEDFHAFARTLPLKNVVGIPICAVDGDNIIQRSAKTPWHSGPTLIGYLETVDLQPAENERAVFPVQWVNRPDSDFRGYCGTLADGSLSVGDEILVTSSGQTAKIANMFLAEQTLSHALPGQSLTLEIDRQIDISRGDVLSLARFPVESTDQFEATLVWMSEAPGLVGRSYDLKLATQWARASLTGIKHKVNVDTQAHEPSRTLALNDICVCNLIINRPIAFDAYQRSKSLGAFILVDHETNATVAAGMVNHSLRRAQNVRKQALSILRPDREKLKRQESKVIWFTGLSGAGKSTLANALEVELYNRGLHTYLLDGDNVRQGLNKDLGFTEADRVENIRRVAEVAKLMMDAGLVVITAFISPFRRDREMVRELVGEENFLEIYVDTPLAVCEQRDIKGLYKKARAGLIPNMSGISSPYEAPDNASLVIRGEGNIQDSVGKILQLAKL